MDEISSKRGAWQAEDNQDGGSSSGSTESKQVLSRSGGVAEPGSDSQPEPAAATTDVDGGGGTGSETPKVDGSRTGTVTDPDRD
jgi:hypothetical protein